MRHQPQLRPMAGPQPKVWTPIEIDVRPQPECGVIHPPPFWISTSTPGDAASHIEEWTWNDSTLHAQPSGAIELTGSAPERVPFACYSIWYRLILASVYQSKMWVKMIQTIKGFVCIFLIAHSELPWNFLLHILKIFVRVSTECRIDDVPIRYKTWVIMYNWSSKIVWILLTLPCITPTVFSNFFAN